MDTLYRRNKVILGSDWHFSELCPQWPVADFVQTSLVDPDQGDRICPICVRTQHGKPRTKRRPTGAKASKVGCRGAGEITAASISIVKYSDRRRALLLHCEA